MKIILKIFTIYHIFYALASFLLLAVIFFLIVDSRGMVSLTPFMFLLVGGLYLVSLADSLISLILVTTKLHLEKIRSFVTILILYLVEVLVLVVPLILFKLNFQLDILLGLALLSVPVTKLLLLIFSIITLFRFKTR